MSVLNNVRAGSGAWAQRTENITAWQEGALFDVKPVTLEFAPILDCNLNCPCCPYARSRHEHCDGRVIRGEFAKASWTAATTEIAKRVLEAASIAGVRGVLWTGGGEPLIWQPLLAMLRFSAKLSMVNAIYTNGVQLGLFATFSYKLLAPTTNVVFVRVSINAVRPETVRRHWGVRDVEDVTPQLSGLRELLKARKHLTAQYERINQRIPSLQISTIIDESNVDDLLPICETVAEIVGDYCDTPNPADAMIVRPTTNHRSGTYSVREHADSVINRIIEVCGKQGAGSRTLNRAGMNLFLGFGLDRIESGEFRNYADLLEHEYASRDYFWANGLFLTVGPDGTVYPCTEHNCDPAWAVGNLMTQSVDEIYRGTRRKEILDIMHSCNLGPAVLEPNTRSSRLNRIAKAIQTGCLSEREIGEIREASIAEPPLLLS